MKILFIGDIVGSPGRRAVKEILPKLRQLLGLNIIIANGENSAGGNGITPDIAAELFSHGVDAITTGDHLWDQKEVMTLLADESRFLRPANYPPETPGRGCGLYPVPGVAGRSGQPLKIGVLNVQGRTFMQPPLDNPFPVAREAIKTLREQTNLIFVDFHAEATSEKIAFARYLDGLASAVVGTHTHVQTADEQIFPGGTAYLSDAGFTGPHESVLGREIEPVIQRFLTSVPQRFEVAKDRVLLHGALIQLDDASGRAVKIQRVSLPL